MENLHFYNLRYWLAALALGIAYSVLFVLPHDAGYLGADGPIHNYYSELLFQQLTAGYSLAGQWDPHLYFGWGFLSVYPPLFTYTVAIARFLTPAASKLVEFLAFPLISLAAFFQVRRVYTEGLVALAGAFSFLSVSAITTVLTSSGTPPYLLTYLFGPLVFGLLWQGRLRSTLIASLCLALVAFSSLDSWLILIPYVWIFTLTSQLPLRRKLLLSLTPALSLLLALPYILPASTHFASVGLTYVTTSFPAGPVSYLVLPNNPGTGPVVALLAVSSMVFFFVFRFEKRLVPIFLTGLVALAAFFTPLELPIIGLFTGRSGVYPLALMVPLMTGYLVVHFPKTKIVLSTRIFSVSRRQILTVAVAALCLSSSLFTAVTVTAGSQNQYAQLYTAGRFLSDLGRTQQTNLLHLGQWSMDSSWTVSESAVSGGNLTGESFARLHLPGPVGNFSASFNITSLSSTRDLYAGMVLRSENGTSVWARWISQYRVFKLEAEKAGAFSQLTAYSSTNASLPLFLSARGWNGDVSFGINNIGLPSIQIGRIVDFELTVYDGIVRFSNLHLTSYTFAKTPDRLKIIMMPRSPVIGNLVLAMNAESPDGWFDQASPTIANQIHLAVDTYSWTDPKAMLGIFQEWGLDYIFVQTNIYYEPTAQKMPLILSNLLQYMIPVYSAGEDYVFAPYQQ